MSIKGIRSFLSILTALLILAFPTASWISYAFGQGEQKFMAALSGQEVVPPLSIQEGAFGIAEFTAMGNNITYFINATGYGNNGTAGYIRIGMPGENGPVVAILWHTERPMNPITVNGTITAEDLMGPMSGNQLTDLVAAMSNGVTYANIHIEPHSDLVSRVSSGEETAEEINRGEITTGDIRGQIRSSSNGGAMLRGNNTTGQSSPPFITLPNPTN
jgi:hypothetical protein